MPIRDRDMARKMGVAASGANKCKALPHRHQQAQVQPLMKPQRDLTTRGRVPGQAGAVAVSWKALEPIRAEALGRVKGKAGRAAGCKIKCRRTRRARHKTREPVDVARDRGERG